MNLYRIVIASLVVVVASADAFAQRGGARSGRRSGGRTVDVDALLVPSISTADMVIVQSHLDMDEGSLLVLETVFDDYAARFAEQSQAIRIQLQEARPGTAGGGSLEGMQRGQQAMQEQLEAMRRQLSQDIRNAGSAEERARIREEFTRRMEELTSQQEAIEDLTGTSDGWSGFLEQQAAILRAWSAARTELEQEFDEAVLIVLQPEQLEAWKQARAEIRRGRQVQRGRLEGERIDLIAVLAEQLPGDELMVSLGPTMEAYAVRLDDAIAVREQFELQAAPVVSDVLRLGDWARMRAIIEEESQVRAGVRDVNLATFDLLLQSLPEPQRSKVADAVHRNFNATIWGKGRFDRVLDAAMERDDLTETERRSLEGIRAQCGPSIDAVRVKQDALLRSQAPTRWSFEQARSWSGSFPEVRFDETLDNEQAAGLNRERQQAEQACMEEIGSVLGAERYAELPGTRTSPAGRSGGSTERQQEAQRRRDELYKEFDSNGDGRLDSDERRVMRDELMRRQREGRGSP